MLPGILMHNQIPTQSMLISICTKVSRKTWWIKKFWCVGNICSKVRCGWSAWLPCRGCSTTENSAHDWSSSRVASRWGSSCIHSSSKAKMIIIASFRMLGCQVLNMDVLFLTGSHRVYDSGQRVWCCSASYKTSDSYFTVSTLPPAWIKLLT